MGLSSVLGIALAGLPSSSVDSYRQEELPSCGVTAVYAVLADLGRAVTVDDVRARFRNADPDVDWNRMSALQIREVLAQYGLPAKTVRVGSQRIESLRLPAILFYGPGRWPQSTGTPASSGHFVVLLETSGDAATVIDWDGVGPQARFTLAVADLVAGWDGEAIVLDDPAGSTSTLLGASGLAACALVMAFLWMNRQKRGRKSLSVSASLFVGLSIPLGGFSCSNTAPVAATPDAPTLRIDEPSVHVGVVHDTHPIHRVFRFQVWEHSAVKIEDVISSCGCTTADKDLLGKELAPGSEHEIQLKVRVERDVGNQSVFAQIVTKPTSSSPLVIGIHYEFSGPPTLSVASLHATASPDTLAEATIQSTHTRAPSAPLIRPERGRCQGDLFDLVDVTSASETVTLNRYSGEKVAVDTHTFRLRARARLDYGRHEGAFGIVWSDGSIAELPTQIHVAFPITVSPARLFCGILAPGRAWEGWLTCDCQSGLSVASVEGSESDTTASLADDGARIRVRVESPRSPGRFSREILVRASDARLPILRVPITGIVKSPGS